MATMSAGPSSDNRRTQLQFYSKLIITDSTFTAPGHFHALQKLADTGGVNWYDTAASVFSWRVRPSDH